MEQVFYALTETLIPWVEGRFGTVASWIVAATLITLPIAGMVAAALWPTRG
ncbi:MAG TPA: hypothetical protein VF637_03380 [Sphingomicrobium sp.]|jgi:hypothetical protein